MYLFSSIYSPRLFEHASKVHPYAYKCKKARQAVHHVHKLLWLPQCVENVQESRSAVTFLASVAHLIIFMTNVGRFPWLGSCSWPLSSQQLFLWVLPWALMEGNSYRTENNRGKKAGGRKGGTAVIVLGVRMVW